MLNREFISQHPLIGNLAVVLLFIAFTFPIVSIILFPFYVRINRRNRKRDEKTSIFPFTNYFFKVTCLTESLSIFGSLLSLLFYLFYNATNYKFTLFIAQETVGIVFLVKMNVAIAINIVVSLLAFFRFFFYFFPRIFGSFKAPLNTFTYLITISLHLLIFCIAILAGYYWTSLDDNIFSEIALATLYLINGTVIFCIFPYFLMILSIRKMSHLSSSQQSNPEKYIKYQIIIIFLGKLFIVPIALIVTGGEGVEERKLPIFMAQLICESLVTPLMVQSAYLMSNKTNHDALKRFMFCEKRGSRVEPRTEVYATSVFQVEGNPIGSNKH